MSLPRHIEQMIHFANPCLKDIAPRTSFDDTFINKVCPTSDSPFGNCSSILLDDRTRLTYIRRFGYLIVDGIAKPTVEPGIIFVKSDPAFQEPKALRIVIEDNELEASRLEDLRLYRNGSGDLRSIGSYIYTDGDMDRREIGIVVLALSISNASDTVIIRSVYKSWKDKNSIPFPRVIKNWMPVADSDSEFVYLIRGGMMTIFDILTGKSHHHIVPFRETLFGSSPTLRLSTGNLLVLCHAHQKSNYEFRLLEVSPEWILLRDSNWFRFSDAPICFCTQMEEHSGTLDFIYTETDRQTYQTSLAADRIFCARQRG